MAGLREILCGTPKGLPMRLGAAEEMLRVRTGEVFTVPHFNPRCGLKARLIAATHSHVDATVVAAWIF